MTEANEGASNEGATGGDGVLAGLRVVEVASGVAGPLAGMMLADFGATVVKIEPPGGDPARAQPGFAVWNRGKRSVTADLHTPGGQATIADLVAGADLCIVGAAGEALAGTVLDPGAVTRTHPALVYLHTPPYTDEVPWAGGQEADPLVAALTGVAARQASFDGDPIDDIYPHLTVVQGVWAAAAAVAALVERSGSGRGQLVMVGGLHGALVAAAGAMNIDPAATEPARRGGNPGGSIPFYRTYRCGDGEWLFLAALTPRFTDIAFDVLGVRHVLDDERLQGGRAALMRPEGARLMTGAMAEAFATGSRDEWLERLTKAGCPAGPVLDRDDWLDHPQLAAIGMRAEVDDPERGRVVMPGIALNLTATPARIQGPAPAAGQHNDDPVPPGDSGVLSARSGRQAPPSGRQNGEGGGAAGRGPLAGIKVIDLGAIIAGPFGASLLGELGAEVIKVEPLTGDSFRGPGFDAYNKGQLGIALNLQDPRGRDALLGLVADADVVLDNYRPGVLERLRLTYDDLRQVQPGIITMSVTGFGTGGPLGQEPGFDPVLQAMSGMMKAQGGDSDPVFFTVPVNDVTAGAAAALATCLALLHRALGGGGQRVWTSLAGMSALVQSGELVRYAGRPPAPLGCRDHKGPTEFDRFHPAAGGWVRAQAPGPLPVEVGGIDKAEAAAHLNKLGVPAAPARRPPDLVGDPIVMAADALRPDPRPGKEGRWTAARLARFSRTERSDTLVAPTLGQHTRHVLGVDAADRLVADGIALAPEAEA